uniref:Putative retrotransposon-like family member retr-1-like protein n=1 Tax=Ixodes ricinus TaxID=34613 RepID=A0A6B0UZS7_IXORI
MKSRGALFGTKGCKVIPFYTLFLLKVYIVIAIKNDKVRISLDPSALNKALLSEHYPMPTSEDFSPSLSGAQYFSTLDATSGFWQMNLDEESSKNLHVITPYSCYKCLRVSFGIFSAAGRLQRAVHKVLAFPGVAVVMENIIFWWRNKDDDDANLVTVLRRCQENNLLLNKKKNCFFL